MCPAGSDSNLQLLHVSSCTIYRLFKFTFIGKTSRQARNPKDEFCVELVSAKASSKIDKCSYSSNPHPDSPIGMLSLPTYNSCSQRTSHSMSRSILTCQLVGESLMECFLLSLLYGIKTEHRQWRTSNLRWMLQLARSLLCRLAEITLEKLLCIWRMLATIYRPIL